MVLVAAGHIRRAVAALELSRLSERMVDLARLVDPIAYQMLTLIVRVPNIHRETWRLSQDLPAKRIAPSLKFLTLCCTYSWISVPNGV
jgi:hypothetical protein